MTIQDQKNITYIGSYITKKDYIFAGGTEAEWNSCQHNDNVGNIYYGCATKGPVTVLSAVESATNTWTNVNIINYTPGTTSFSNNSYTGCTRTSCNENTYIMGERSARARLITVSEAWNTGCNASSDRSCPKYMYNFLRAAE